jgi:tetratricopeptide (TPR) repeat protein
MKKRTAILAVIVLLPCARGQDDLKAIWSDPIFKKQFIGAYGINAEVEPRIKPDEVATLEKVRPLMEKTEDLPKAEEMLKGRIKPDSSAILDVTLAGIQFQQDKVPEALATYQRAVDKYPSFRRAWRNLGITQARTGNNDGAITAFTKMIELGGGDAYSYGLLGFAYSAKQDYQPAEAAFRNALLLQPDNVEWRLGLARSVFRQQKYEDTVSLLEVLIARNPDNAGFWMTQAQAYLALKRPLKAAENLEALAGMGKATADNLHTLGDVYVTENLPDLAIRAYERAIDLDPQQPFARAFRSAELLLSRGANSQARQLATQVGKVLGPRLQDTDRRKLLKLEARMSMAEGASGPETIAVLEEIVKLDPLDGEALMLLGQHYAKHNEPDRAILYYERAEKIEAFEIIARVRHAQVLVNMSRHTDAIPLLRRVQEMKPRDDVARYLEQVERLAKARR